MSDMRGSNGRRLRFGPPVGAAQFCGPGEKPELDLPKQPGSAHAEPRQNLLQTDQSVPFDVQHLHQTERKVYCKAGV